MKRESFFLSQFVPIALTVVIFFILSVFLFSEIVLLNRYTLFDIILKLRLSDIMVGLIIYLKTSVDFAILMGNLMDRYGGWRNRVAIEAGTAVGNAIGTMIILATWTFFKEIEWLLAIMVFVASLVLLRLAEDGLEHAKSEDARFPHWFKSFVVAIDKTLFSINTFNKKILKYIVPHATMKPNPGLSFWGLFLSSFTIPFILGLDDFAGYVPLFSIVNVFGFAVGVFGGHMALNMALFIAPDKTVKAVKNPVISLVGSLAFVGLAIFGFVEVYKILILHY